MLGVFKCLLVTSAAGLGEGDWGARYSPRRANLATKLNQPKTQ
jgi:hypothetical protein